MDRSIRRRVVGALMVGMATLSAAGRARAEPSPDDRALATVLFQEGRALMSAGRIPEACLKLEESERLDPGGGTILNLALCHERQGRLARSWSEFNEGLVRARRDGRRDREIEAAEHVRALDQRLSRLSVVVSAGADVPGLRVERDGGELGRGAWSTAIPVDGGEHVVRATAPGKQPFTATVVIGAESDARTIEIPVLATPVVVVTSPNAATPAIVSVPRPEIWRRLRSAAMGTAALGVLALGTAGYVFSTALAKKSDSMADCTGDVCGEVGLRLRKDAVSRGNLATILGLGGAALIGAGATVFFLGRSSRSPKPEAGVRTGLLFGATPGTVVTGLEGRF